MTLIFLFGCQSGEQTYRATVFTPDGNQQPSTDLETTDTSEYSTEVVESDLTFGGVLRRLETSIDISPEDIEIAQQFMDSQSNNRVFCDDIWRVQLSPQYEVLQGPEMVWPHASVPDVLILESGEHLLVYNDLRKGLFMDILLNEPTRFWRQGLLGYGGIGFSIDKLDGNGFVEMVDVDLQFSRLQRAVDPDLGHMLDGTVRLSWFGMPTEVLGDGSISPMETAKPHRFYRNQLQSGWTFSQPLLAVASSVGRTGGVDPSILTLSSGGEIMYVGPLDEYVVGWYSENLADWPSEPNVDTMVSGATVDALYSPAGRHEIFYMRNGNLGSFELQASENGFEWSIGPEIVYFETDAHNPTFDYDSTGNLWLYYNLWDAECLAAAE